SVLEVTPQLKSIPNQNISNNTAQFCLPIISFYFSTSFFLIKFQNKHWHRPNQNNSPLRATPGF
ncbi:unnamed protein product, partial [Arabidopsis halleri]